MKKHGTSSNGKRRYRCLNPDCPYETFSQSIDYPGRRRGIKPGWLTKVEEKGGQALRWRAIAVYCESYHTWLPDRSGWNWDEKKLCQKKEAEWHEKLGYHTVAWISCQTPPSFIVNWCIVIWRSDMEVVARLKSLSFLHCSHEWSTKLLQRELLSFLENDRLALTSRETRCLSVLFNRSIWLVWRVSWPTERWHSWRISYLFAQLVSSRNSLNFESSFKIWSKVF